MPRRTRRDAGVLLQRWQDLLLVWKLLWDEEVNPGLKLLPLLAMIYLFFPLDLLPDALLGPGQVDDIGVVLLALMTFVKLAPPERVARARGELPAEGNRIEDDSHTFDEER